VVSSERLSHGGFTTELVALSNQANPPPATGQPSRPPANDSTMLSIRSCRMMRQRPAPMATRIEISRDLPAARESSMFATLAQAIRRTKPPAAHNATKRGRMAYTPVI